MGTCAVCAGQLYRRQRRISPQAVSSLPAEQCLWNGRHSIISVLPQMKETPRKCVVCSRTMTLRKGFSVCGQCGQRHKTVENESTYFVRLLWVASVSHQQPARGFPVVPGDCERRARCCLLGSLLFLSTFQDIRVITRAEGIP